MYTINLDNLISALSLVLDLAENKKLEHARRTAYISVAIAEELNLSSKDIWEIYYAALLHDIGKAFLEQPPQSVASHDSKSTIFDNHSAIGANIVNQIPYLESIQPIIAQHHEFWDGTGNPMGLKGCDILIGARIITLADIVEYHFGHKYAQTTSQELIDFIYNNMGKAFDPDISKAFMGMIKNHNFLQNLALPKIDYLLQAKRPTNFTNIHYNDLETIGEIFAKLIDRKSTFTASHSLDVAIIAEAMAQKAKLNSETVQKIKISGLLHDLGKIVIPNHILDKPAKLTNDEYRIIQSHSYYTELILNEIPSLEDIKLWSSVHHEKLDGSGYHHSLPGTVIPFEGRIIAIADIYHALTANRPYRQGMGTEKALTIIEKECQLGRLDYPAFELLTSII